MRVAQIIFDISVIDTARQRRFITATGPYTLPFFTNNNRSAGILTGWQNTFRRDVGVAQELQRHIFIIFAGFRVTQNVGHLLLVSRTQHK
ncbi:Uncharacterised protein [Shigella sonnei]|nr:Uncharacterised protein [Shigella sonnei]